MPDPVNSRRPFAQARRYSALRGRPLTSYEQLVERLAATRAGAWTFVHALSLVDRRLLPLTRGRISLAVGAPVGVLECRGARSRQCRRVPLLYLLDGARVVVVASNGGSHRQPAWLHNVRADADVRFLTRENGWRRYRARLTAGAERDRCWEQVTDLYGGYRDYQTRTAGREIPLVVLEPSA